ncbi:hypothetical protein [Neopusillimonas maritima]|uniref:Uncharacterized protein n=1 Tax=Neopusillimonas maritima TaxID=2026239 RepID=A0A3A1YUN0_9BURK|nr:hypothetical protein [Neopusillimonas maritima]RIY41963.1 hypothetical protein CJP73_00510 [Neopusillimonas maritima]
MLFCVSVCDEDRRVILDDEPHGDVLAVIEAADWIEAREQAWEQKALDPYSYKRGYGWEIPMKSGML